MYSGPHKERRDRDQSGTGAIPRSGRHAPSAHLSASCATLSDTEVGKMWIAPNCAPFHTTRKSSNEHVHARSRVTTCTHGSAQVTANYRSTPHTRNSRRKNSATACPSRAQRGSILLLGSLAVPDPSAQCPEATIPASPFKIIVQDPKTHT